MYHVMINSLYCILPVLFLAQVSGKILLCLQITYFFFLIIYLVGTLPNRLEKLSQILAILPVTAASND